MKKLAIVLLTIILLTSCSKSERYRIIKDEFGYYPQVREDTHYPFIVYKVVFIDGRIGLNYAHYHPDFHSCKTYKEADSILTIQKEYDLAKEKGYTVIKK